MLWALFNLFPIVEVVKCINLTGSLKKTISFLLVDEKCVMGFGQNIAQMKLAIENQSPHITW